MAPTRSIPLPRRSTVLAIAAALVAAFGVFFVNMPTVYAGAPPQPAYTSYCGEGLEAREFLVDPTTGTVPEASQDAELAVRISQSVMTRPDIGLSWKVATVTVSGQGAADVRQVQAVKGLQGRAEARMRAKSKPETPLKVVVRMGMRQEIKAVHVCVPTPPLFCTPVAGYLSYDMVANTILEHDIYDTSATGGPLYYPAFEIYDGHLSALHVAGISPLVSNVHSVEVAEHTPGPDGNWREVPPTPAQLPTAFYDAAPEQANQPGWYHGVVLSYEGEICAHG